jgi:Methylamine utilisation protein MauE
MSVDPLFVSIALACIATLFAHAAIAKAMDLALFEQHLAALGMPHALLGIASRAVPAAEVLAALLLFTPWRAAGAALAATLLLLYGAVMALHVARGRTPDCGCGGEPLPVSWALVFRNGALAALAALAAAPMAARAMSIGDFFVVAAALLLATLLYAALHQVLRHRAVHSQRALFRRT